MGGIGPRSTACGSRKRRLAATAAAAQDEAKVVGARQMVAVSNRGESKAGPAHEVRYAVLPTEVARGRGGEDKEETDQGSVGSTRIKPSTCLSTREGGGGGKQTTRIQGRRTQTQQGRMPTHTDARTAGM